MMDDFLLRALLGGVGAALAAGPLGCFVVWRRMAYFGDALSHAALLGLALGVLLGWAPLLGVIASGLVFALLLGLLEDRAKLASDTALGLLSHGGLALGLVALALMPGMKIDLMGYLFGDILAVGVTDLIWIWGGGALVLGGLAFLWRPLLSLSVHEELARVEGVPAAKVKLGFLLLVALAVAVAMKAVGVLLITALLIIPPAAARPLVRSPEAMALLAALAGALSVAGGLAASMVWDIPAGPAIVCAQLAFFLLSRAVTRP
jgi:zinc transport system permease protein